MFCVISYSFIYFFFIYNDSRQTNYFKIYRTNLRQIFRVDRTMAVDDQPEISFPSLKGLCHGKQSLLVLSTENTQYFCGFIHRTDLLDAGG